MRIISDFADYYDVDLPGYEYITYLRKTKKVDSLTGFKVMNMNEYMNTVCSFSGKAAQKTTITEWEVVCFIIGYSGTLRKGVKITYNGKKEVSYTLTGVYHLSTKLGFTIPQFLENHIQTHLECNPIQNIEAFKLLSTPLFIIHQSSMKVFEIFVNPNLSEYDFYKIEPAIKMNKGIHNFIDTILDPADPVACYQSIPSRVYGTRWSSWDPSCVPVL